MSCGKGKTLNTESLPREFLEAMKRLLGEEYDSFLSSYDDEHAAGLRVNTAKITPEEFLRVVSGLPGVPWTDNGFYTQDSETESPLSKHPYYHAGLFYIQEPSAMAPGALIPLEEGLRVLDLCAAPGGKSTQLGARLNGSGLLVSNDISASRARALLKNLELFGIGNALILSESPDRLAQVFEGYFDRILVDAPCSGEGMFRKNRQVARNWEQYGSGYYADLQKQILPQAVKMLAPGGYMLYSTCTFSVLEDEMSLEWLLKEFPQMHIVPIPAAKEMFEKGIFVHAGVKESSPEGIENAARLYPHRLKGEGHFVALLQKEGESPRGGSGLIGAKKEFKSDSEGLSKCEVNKYGADVRKKYKSIPAEAFDFFETLGIRIPAERIRVKGTYASLDPDDDLPAGAETLRTLRNGLLLGEIKKGRFEPSQALAMALKKDEFANTISFPADSQQTIRYLKCETVMLEDDEDTAADGNVLVCTDGYPLGWAKKKGKVLKNRYLPGWRML